ncbi:signal peptidase I [Candidatus Berkiella cookevillensis]|uniref:Signal peptidase I n=2 Tax=Candidatus Berkiella cookevillensis TaxID=437022 RepID=A0A0Q9YHT9_9GAMM|nr:signal peptidase I [Candidatus Berkiella cookevillensis]
MKYYMDFSVILAIGTIVCAVVWALDTILFKKKRLANANGDVTLSGDPKIVEYAKSFFPILLVVFLLRSFLAEPFRIPSGSMKPTLLTGDFILVNKFSYGFRMPLLGKKIIEKGTPKRGDVLVFRYPKDTSVDFIKRVVAIPGDKVTYKNKKLYINDEMMAQSFQEQIIDMNDYGMVQSLKRITEQLDTKAHSIYIDDMRPDTNVEVIVPEGHYFVMGDNRDNSDDSRKWGFVPDELIIGKAIYVWMSWDTSAKDVRWKRIGTAIN